MTPNSAEAHAAGLANLDPPMMAVLASALVMLANGVSPPLTCTTTSTTKYARAQKSNKESIDQPIYLESSHNMTPKDHTADFSEMVLSFNTSGACL
jgi:hypothetical protein